MANVTLIPIQEMAPGQATAIRRGVISAVVRKASAELSLPENKLVVRDIRPFNDLDFGNNTAYLATAATTDVWSCWKVTDTYVLSAASGGSYVNAISANKTMADNRYIAIYGARDWRMSRPTINDYNVTLIRFNIGNADKVIWDLSKMEAYQNFVAGMTSSAIVIPPLAAYQISCYLRANSIETCLQLMGVVVEPVGLLVTP